MQVQPTPQQLEELQKALLDAFDHAALTQLTRIHLNLRLEWITPVIGKRDLTTIVIDLVDYYASQENGLKVLHQAAINANPTNRLLQKLFADWKPLTFVKIELRDDHPHHIIIMGDSIAGDNFDVSNIDGQGIAIGRNAQATVNNFIQQSLSTVDETEKARLLEQQRLAEGVRDYAARLRILASNDIDAWAGGPYRGLISYTMRESALFFGRSHAQAQLLEQIRSNRLTVLQSESGAGKSSLLQAGIMPRLLGAGHLPIVLRPYDESPGSKLRKLFLPSINKNSALAQVPLREYLRQVSNVVGTERTLYLMIDQFEEFFTLLANETAAAFVDELADCIEDQTLNAHWLLAVRSEFFGDLANFRPRINPFQFDYRLNCLTRDEAQQAIAGPARLFRIKIDTELISYILDNLQDKNEVSPPQIQLVCTALYTILQEERKAALDTISQFTLSMFDQEGGVNGILRGHLNRVLLNAFSHESERKFARQLLVELLTSERRRIRLTRSELAKRFSDEQLSTANLDLILSVLVDNRLVNADDAENIDDATYELAHDYLIEEIQLDPEVQAQKAAQELLDQETQYYKRHGTLLSTDKFDIINSQQTGLVLDSPSEELLSKSKEAIEKEIREREAARQLELEQAQRLADVQKKRAEESAASERQQRRSANYLRLLAIGLGLAALAAGFTTWFAFRQSNIATAGMLAIQARDQSDLRLATLLALEAESLAPMVTDANSLLTHDLFERNRLFYVDERTDYVEHSGGVIGAAWSPDGKILASSSDDSTIRLWDVDGSKTPRILTDHTDSVNSISWSPDGTSLASGSSDESIRLWDIATSVPVRSLLGHSGPVNTVAWSPDGTMLASGGSDSKIILWNVVTGRQVQLLQGHADNIWTATKDTNSARRASGVMSVAWSPDGTMLASGGSDSKIILWNVVTGRQVQLLQGHGFWVLSVAWSPDGTMLASGSEDKTIKLWDVITGETKQTLQNHISGISTVAWSPDGKILASGAGDTIGNDLAIKLWDVATGDTIQTLAGHRNHVRTVAWSPDGMTIASGALDKTVKLWRMTLGKSIQTLSGHVSGITSVAWSPDGTALASGSEDRTVILWDLSKENEVRPLIGHNSGVRSVAWSPDGSLLASGSGGGLFGNDYTIKLWEPTTGRLEQSLAGHTSSVESIAWSPDGSTLASGANHPAWSFDTNRLWNIATGEPIENFMTLIGHQSNVNSVAWSPDGSTLASGAGDVMRGENTIKLWDITRDGILGSLSGHKSSVNSVAWSPDGTLLVSGSADNTIKLWDVKTLRVVKTLRGHKDGVTSIAWSPDGTTLASGSLDSTIRLWDAATGELLHTLQGHTDLVSSVAWSPDSTTLASGSFDNTIKLWPVQLISNPCILVTDNLSTTEWKQFHPGMISRSPCTPFSNNTLPNAQAVTNGRRQSFFMIPQLKSVIAAGLGLVGLLVLQRIYIRIQ
ncbi:MAG: effector-associated domain EAD1-containing protein [Chloroflexota bacterium]